jgi:predicted regulator of Ras-like GTPase activity (Roadblock/LC7/MglB family)
MEELNKLLHELANIPGVQAALVVGSEGFIIDGVTKSSSLDKEAIAATISAQIGSTSAMGEELHLGGMSHLMIEYDCGVIVINTISPDALLAVVADHDAFLGNVRYQVKKYTQRIDKLL